MNVQSTVSGSDQEIEKMLGNKQMIDIFAANVNRCLELTGRNKDSLAVRAEVDKMFLVRLLARGDITRLNKVDVDAICADFNLSLNQLFYNYGSSARMRLRELLKEEGVKLADAEGIQEDSTDDESLYEEANSVEEETETEEEFEELELTWCDEGLVATASDGEVFDLKSKKLRHQIIGRVRPFFADTTQKAFLKDAGLEDKSSNWMYSIDRGVARIYLPEVEKLAKGCEVGVYRLLKGTGMRVLHVATRNGKNGDVVTVSVPSVSSAEVQQYFRERFLSKRTILVNGKTAGDALQLMRDESQVTDWMSVFIEWTEEGQKLQSDINRITKFFTGKADPIKVLILRSFSEALAE